MCVCVCVCVCVWEREREREGERERGRERERERDRETLGAKGGRLRDVCVVLHINVERHCITSGYCSPSPSPLYIVSLSILRCLGCWGFEEIKCPIVFNWFFIFTPRQAWRSYLWGRNSRDQMKSTCLDNYQRLISFLIKKSLCLCQRHGWFSAQPAEPTEINQHTRELISARNA